MPLPVAERWPFLPALPLPPVLPVLREDRRESPSVFSNSTFAAA